ncbi:DUF2723 domain-containing protein [Candidatus Poribacteria bacterium]|nr:DUF2723 domain-containing protein [Candidatus Poribacteria bacterium]
MIVGRILPPLFVFLASLTVYVCTMPPDIAAVGYAADTLKFQYIGKVFGTPHFGYPTYMFLNIIVSRLPVFNLAYRLNLLSAVLASATLVVLYFIVLSVLDKRRCGDRPAIRQKGADCTARAQTYPHNSGTRCGIVSPNYGGIVSPNHGRSNPQAGALQSNGPQMDDSQASDAQTLRMQTDNSLSDRLIAVACALLFGVTYTFWENSIIAEVYSLHTLFMCGVMLLMLHWEESRRPLFYYFACLVYAVSFGNHLVGITMLPALVYWTLAVDHTILFKKRTYLLIALFILLGMAQYGYVLARSRQVPPQEKVFQYWPYFEDFGKTHLESYARSVPELLNVVSGGGWRNRLAQYSPAKPDFKDRLPLFYNLFLLQYSPAGLILGATGIAFSFLKRRRRAIFFSLLLAAHMAFVVTWGVPGIDVHVIPAYLILAIFIAHNDNFFRTAWVEQRPVVRRIGRACLVALLAALIVFLTLTRYRRLDQSKNVWLADMLETAIPRIPDNSIIFTNHVYATAFWQKLYGEDARPGVRITVHPIWTICREDLVYALRRYQNVFYFLDEPYWGALAEMGIDFEIRNFSSLSLGSFLSGFEPGEIVASYAVVEEEDTAREAPTPPFPNGESAPPFLNGRFTPPFLNGKPVPPFREGGMGGFSILGLLERNGSIRILMTTRGAFSLRKGAEVGGIKLPVDIRVAPGETIYIDGVDCSRYRKRNNLVVLDPVSGKVKAMVYVDWMRGTAVDPAYALLVRGTKRVSRNCDSEGAMTD